MKLFVISLRDIVANVYNIPSFTPHIGHAIRSFGDECQKKDSQSVVGHHPEDFELWLIGEYDDNTGQLIPFAPEERKQLAVGANYRHQ